MISYEKVIEFLLLVLGTVATYLESILIVRRFFVLNTLSFGWSMLGVQYFLHLWRSSHITRVGHAIKITAGPHSCKWVSVFVLGEWSPTLPPSVRRCGQSNFRWWIWSGYFVRKRFWDRDWPGGLSEDGWIIGFAHRDLKISKLMKNQRTGENLLPLHLWLVLEKHKTTPSSQVIAFLPSSWFSFHFEGTWSILD